MIGTHAEVGDQKLFAARMRAPTVRLDGHKYGINQLTAQARRPTLGNIFKV